MEAMCNSEFEPLQRQRMHRMALIRELLVHSYREVELYRQGLDRAGVDPVEVSYPRNFSRVPVTSKNDLRSGFPDRQLARGYRHKALRYSNTSGTTGQPLLLIQDIKDISFKYASILRSRRVAGVDPMGSQARITPNECQPCLPDGESPSLSSPLSRDRSGPGTRASLFVFLERSVVNPFFHQRLMLDPFWLGPAISSPVDYDRWLKQVNDYEPDILSMYPLYAMILAKHIRRTGATPPRIKGMIDFSGGISTPAMRKYIEEAFGIRTAQSCGGCEFARYASSCPEDPDRMHLAESYCYVETARADGTMCSPGELGNLVVTSLHSHAMPIIRLEPGDVGRIIEEPCSCGRRSRRLEHHGRIQALIRTEDGRWVSGREVWDKLLLIRGLEMFQLVQRKPNRYLLRVVPQPDSRLDQRGLDAALEALLGKNAKIEQEITTGLKPERSGKLQLVKSCTFEAFRVQDARRQPIPVN
ncbi:MAG: phenylacetate-CoA ligase [Myxococcota bacterium]|jgi:phenylacetate-CoA ligase